jgi:hypothetical protein
MFNPEQNCIKFLEDNNICEPTFLGLESPALTFKSRSIPPNFLHNNQHSGRFCEKHQSFNQHYQNQHGLLDEEPNSIMHRNQYNSNYRMPPLYRDDELFENFFIMRG